jgi:tripartite-type tricarboxylate transporter receptor subunit TctC
MRSATRTAVYAALTLAMLCGLLLPASADAVADFYKGKRITMMVGSEAGGGYDGYARLVTRHLGKFIPGNPDFIVQNMPGGGGLRVTNNLYNVQPKDGTAMGTVQRAILTAPLLESRNTEIKYDPMKFNWLGSLNTETGLIVVWKDTAPHRTMKDLFEKELMVGSSGPSTDFMPLFLNNVIGTKFKIIAGYKSSTDAYLAVERGEVQGRISNGYSGDKNFLDPWKAKDKVVFLAQLSTVKNPLFPDLPLILDFARNDREKQAMTLILSSQVWGRPFVMPPGVPEDRVAAVTKAFAAMMKDPEFLADAKKSNIDIDTTSAEEMKAMLQRVYATPPDLVEVVRKAIAADER